jgi:hypothetical protein
MTTVRDTSIAKTVRCGVIAGAMGGLAEVLWVTLYAEVTGGDAAILARGITTAVGMTAMAPDASVAVGIVVHMAAAVALGVALAFAWRSLASHVRSAAVPYAFTLAALATVWVVNFFVVAPLFSPEFTLLVPYAVSLTSKLLFGFTAAEVLRRSSEVRVRALVRVSVRR